MKLRPKSSWSAALGKGTAAAPASVPEAKTDQRMLLAERLRQCYDDERASWESLKRGALTDFASARVYRGRDAVTTDDGVVLDKARASVWLKLADWLAENELPAEPYVTLQFTLVMPSERPPEPIQLTSKKYLKRWHDNKDRVSDEIAQALLVQNSLAQTHFKVRRSLGDEPLDAWGTVLTNDSLELSALFRYSIARALGKEFKKIARLFEPDAVLQFERDRAFYLESWGKILPKDFPGLSKRLFPYLLAHKASES